MPLAQVQQSTSSKGLTILYGENGTGKTGYARILKRISAVQYPEEILSDINSNATPTPTAAIAYELNDVCKSIEWHNEIGVSPFTRLSVFDSPSVNVRVDQNLAYVFTPAEISLFSYVSAGIRAIQERGSRALDELTLPNPFIRHFHRGTDTYQEIEALGPATDLDALATLAALPEDAQDERERLERKVAALRSDAASGLLAAHREAMRTLERLDVLAQRAETFEIDQYNDALVALATLRESYRASQRGNVRSRGTARTRRRQLATIRNFCGRVLAASWNNALSARRRQVHLLPPTARF